MTDESEITAEITQAASRATQLFEEALPSLEVPGHGCPHCFRVGGAAMAIALMTAQIEAFPELTDVLTPGLLMAQHRLAAFINGDAPGPTQ